PGPTQQPPPSDHRHRQNPPLSGQNGYAQHGPPQGYLPHPQSQQQDYRSRSPQPPSQGQPGGYDSRMGPPPSQNGGFDPRMGPPPSQNSSYGSRQPPMDPRDPRNDPRNQQQYGLPPPSLQPQRDMYKSGGLLSVTSRILVVDMLNGIIPVDLVTGLVVMHAELVTPTSLEAFVVRIYRQRNKTGFIKAFSDEPEAFTFGMSPLQTVLQQLHIREALIWPRFHELVSEDLAKRTADVIELYQPMTDNMKEIQTAVIECMEATLSEIKKSNSYLEVEDLTVENALFRSFDSLVRRQLDPVWHKVGPKTKGLVSDLTTLRKLQAYLLEFDSVSFNRFLETILTAQNTTKGGFENKHKSPWLFTPAADTIFTLAQQRAYRKVALPESKAGIAAKGKGKGREEEEGPPLDEFAEWEEEEEVLRAMEMSMMEEKEDEEVKKRRLRDRTLPPGHESVLEEQPKWSLLADILAEVEDELYWSPVDPYGVSNNTILIMTTSADTCSTLREYLSRSADGDGGQTMLHAKLQRYFWWKRDMGKMAKNMKQVHKTGYQRAPAAPKTGEMLPTEQGFESAAMKRKREYQRGQAPNTKRRRVRGGGVTASQTGGHSSQDQPATTSTTTFAPSTGADGDALAAESEAVASIMDATTADASAPAYMLPDDQPATVFSEIAFNEFFGLLANEDLVIIRPYMGDEDDRVLEEIRPKYVIMYDPNPAFVRRIEVSFSDPFAEALERSSIERQAYRSAHQGLAVRVYFLMYKDSVEEQRYLSMIRKEKDAFERLIREKGVMAIPHEAEYRPGDEESAALRTISSRIAGGSKQVIVDVREFRSSLPSLLHAGGFDVVPTTISIGDYIITPEMCVERKAIPDLISSFNSGRLYQQCEQMTAHYIQPILLIEFDEKKSFNLETYANERSTGKNEPPSTEVDLRSKIVLLTITFPKLRIIWSSSPYQTVDIFRELKENRDEPDVAKAVSVGIDEAAGGATAEGSGEAGLAFAPQELLRCLPGITTTNYRYVMGKVENIEALCELPLEGVQELIGAEKGKTLYRFLHQNITNEEVP
ncbi:DNA excision repair protein ERCC-4, partial [Phenoliferia sp. Uapishka_3]